MQKIRCDRQVTFLKIKHASCCAIEIASCTFIALESSSDSLVMSEEKE